MPAEADARTRDRVARALSEAGPLTATALAERLCLTPAAVRRHLDALLQAGSVEAREEPAVAGTPRRRGRPARVFALTRRGHAALATAYDDLAVSALRFLARAGGAPAVAAFAEARSDELEARYAPQVAEVGDDPGRRLEALAVALAEDGYAATVRTSPGGGAQLCQGHCPVQAVAAEFPQLCDAETESFARIVGVPARRLATLAHGEHVCTTHLTTSSPPTTSRPTTISTQQQTAEGTSS